uniref:Uncharacterized protein n=1 Tax=Daphnia galeata TaxID=27404 RepID=A0A8J2WFG2_9CRUS|nr:unnamed protein product [Daphnia galeata]
MHNLGQPDRHQLLNKIYDFPFANYMNSSAADHKHQFCYSSHTVDMKLFFILILLAVAAAAPTSSKKESDDKAPEITIVSQSDVRHVNGTNEWNYALSDGTSRFQMWFPQPAKPSKASRR